MAITIGIFLTDMKYGKFKDFVAKITVVVLAAIGLMAVSWFIILKVMNYIS